MDPFSPGRYDPEQDIHRITLYSHLVGEQQHMSLKPRLYLHLDMNCFYAQVEQYDHDLFGYPVAIGGYRRPDGTTRGIVATSSYEARAFGVKTGMSAFEADQLCPEIIFFQVNYQKYKLISRDLDEVLQNFAPDVEPYSLDEYFLDITHMLEYPEETIADFCKSLKRAIWNKVRLKCSVGVSYSKVYAKLASDMQKPDGMTLILNEKDAAERIWPLPINEVIGIGGRRYARLTSRGLYTIEDAIERGSVPFQKAFGEYMGKMLWTSVTGQDKGLVQDNRNHIPKEVGYGHTFPDQTWDPLEIRAEVAKGIISVCYRMRAYKKKSKTFTIGIVPQALKHPGFWFKITTEGHTNIDDYVLENAMPSANSVIKHALQNKLSIRAVRVYTRDMMIDNQFELFFAEDQRKRNLLLAMDTLNNTMGPGTVHKGILHERVKGHTHFLERTIV